MKGFVARKGNRWYAVVYEGIDPATVGSVVVGIPLGPSEATQNVSPHTSPPTSREATTKSAP